MKKGTRTDPLPIPRKKSNREKSRVRARAKVKIGMMNIVYNICRSVQLKKVVSLGQLCPIPNK